MTKWLKRMFGIKQEPKSYFDVRWTMKDGKSNIRAYIIDVDEDGNITESALAPMPEWCAFELHEDTNDVN